jgi:multiple sugar transport system ATP-binding protein
MKSVRLERCTVAAEGRLLLDEVDLFVGAGERVAVLGASGAGKTTLLRLVAGLDAPRSGRVLLDGTDVTHRGPRERDVAMLFPRGALQPHLRVRDNLALPLRVRHHRRAEVERRVTAEARAFTIEDLLERRPSTLAGGARQVVGLARALVRRSGVLLADEPATGLDDHQRATVIGELLRVQEGYGTTLLLATNDPRLATTVGQRIAVLDAGALVQVDTPQGLRERPVNRLVADLATPWPLIALSASVQRRSGRVVVVAPPVEVPTHHPDVLGLVGRSVTLAAQPEALRLTGVDDERRGTFDARVTERTFLGAHVQVTLAAAIGTTGAEVPALVAAPGPDRGELVRARLDPARIHLYDPDGDALAHGI